jgi:hypothetical protein
MLFSCVYRVCKELETTDRSDEFFERMDLVCQILILTDRGRLAAELRACWNMLHNYLDGERSPLSDRKLQQSGGLRSVRTGL